MLDCKHTIYYNWHTSHIVKTQAMWTKFCYGTKFCVQRLFLISDFTTQKEGRKTHSVQECVFFCPKRKVFLCCVFQQWCRFSATAKRTGKQCLLHFICFDKSQRFCCKSNSVAFPEHVSKEALLLNKKRQRVLPFLLFCCYLPCCKAVTLPGGRLLPGTVPP